MTAQLRQDPLTQSPAGDVGPAHGPTYASATRWRQQKWGQEQEKEWEGHLQSLQQCICELLIKNQQLRASLESTTIGEFKGRGNEYIQRFERI